MQGKQNDRQARPETERACITHTSWRYGAPMVIDSILSIVSLSRCSALP